MIRLFDGIFHDREISKDRFLIPLHFIRDDGNEKILIPENTVENMQGNPGRKRRGLV